METAKERLERKYHLYLSAKVAKQAIKDIAEAYGEIVFWEGFKSALEKAEGRVFIFEKEEYKDVHSVWEMLDMIIALKEEEMEEKVS